MKFPEIEQLLPLAPSPTPPANFPAEQPFAPDVAGQYAAAATGSICIWSLPVSAAEQAEFRARAGKTTHEIPEPASGDAGLPDLFAGVRAAPEIQRRLAALVDQLAQAAAANGWATQRVSDPGLPFLAPLDRRSFRAGDRYLEIWATAVGAEPGIIVIAGPENA